jgi:hypothetical protein
MGLCHADLATSRKGGSKTPARFSLGVNRRQAMSFSISPGLFRERSERERIGEGRDMTVIVEKDHTQDRPNESEHGGRRHPGLAASA